MHTRKSRMTSNLRARPTRKHQIGARSSLLSEQDRPVYYAMVATFVLLGTLTYGLPDDVLSRNPWLDHLIN